MISPRLVAIITALSLIGGAGSAVAQFTIEELERIEQLIAAKDRYALWIFLHNNPQYMTGDDPLAAELRAFYGSAYDEMIARLSVPASPVAVAQTSSNDDDSPLPY